MKRRDNVELGKIYNGFRLIQEKNIKEIKSIARIFNHEKSGARLLHLENDDDNKVFSITFRTPPKDSTGVAHILEHSVLCGSRKFDVKEPFVELIKGSLNTFLNAMTFPDKTMYPVASRNEKDFFNLMDVYMDAVLYPNIYKYPEILMQEGWHYELDNKEDEITYKGVVYNEMKGAFSSPESVLFRKISESLFPNTTYGVESGGDPDFIPNLTYEKFLDFHRKYYHPSNSYIYLYGDADILKELEFLNENYLKNFEKINVDSDILLEKPFNHIIEKVIEYPISENEIEEDKTFLSLNFVTEKSTNPEMYLALDILEYLLLETPAAPLKKSISQSGIAKDVFGYFNNSTIQTTFSIIAKNSNEISKCKFKEIVFNTLNKLVEEGINKKLIESSINIKEFEMREADFQSYPTGLIYNIKCMDSWLYNENPIMHLEYEKQIENIKQYSKEDYFEKIIKKYLIDNSHCSLLVVKPKKGLEEEKSKKIKEKLKKYKESLSEEEIINLIDKTSKLKKRQVTPDSEEKIKNISLLSIKDINKEADFVHTCEKQELGVNVLHHNIFTNKIAYLNLYFDMSTVEEKLIPYASLLTSLIGKVNTEKYKYEDLSKEVNINTGGISYNTRIYSQVGLYDKYSPKFVVKGKSLIENIPKLFELISEEICNSKFDDEKRLKELIMEIKSRLEMILLDRGHIFTANRVASYYSKASKYSEYLSGLDFYKFISNLEKNFDNKVKEIKISLEKVSKIIFNKQNLIASITLEEENYSSFKDNFEILIKNLKNNNLPKLKLDLNILKENEGIMTSGKVQYVSKGNNFIKLGYQYKGSMQVLKTIANYDYLWNKIRVQGGAYGCFVLIEKSGNIILTSYRDPNLIETLNAYSGIKDYIKNFKTTDREMTKYIIGTIARLDIPLTPSMKGERGDAYYFSGITKDIIQKERDEILSTTEKDIQDLFELISKSVEEDYICVLGNEEKIKDNSDIFNKTINLFN
ncbi:insulinase family protein [Clostridium acetireducens]|uniref:insulinase family protein n=1 Tax=Clostridium acetireducens TaxID=76489 RepID=UPI000872F02F|nr:insulinase family protein [Clostridium acetireducens]